MCDVCPATVAPALGDRKGRCPCNARSAVRFETERKGSPERRVTLGAHGLGCKTPVGGEKKRPGYAGRRGGQDMD